MSPSSSAFHEDYARDRKTILPSPRLFGLGLALGVTVLSFWPLLFSHPPFWRLLGAGQSRSSEGGSNTRIWNG